MLPIQILCVSMLPVNLLAIGADYRRCIFLSNNSSPNSRLMLRVKVKVTGEDT